MKFIKYAFIPIFLLVATLAHAQKHSTDKVEMSYYLPDDVSYDSSIPTPEEVIGMTPGEWHVRHDQLLRYMRVLAKASDRIAIHKYGETYEGRDLIYLTVTSPSNLGNIDQIRKQHLKLTNAQVSDELDVEEMPVVLYLGYSIHGDEPSGSNASMLVAYHLAAAQGPEIEQTLQNSVILLDPSYNPDGLSRFAQWVNSHKSLKGLNADPNAMEHNQRWPSGRTNHYYFDLNRDWMPVQHPASQGRIAVFHKWKPNVLTDHHEMGKNSTFFFQPGIPSRTHPLTPERNQELTQAIAQYHAEFLDRQDRLYYSKESYDDFYYGKGSTYPDINGAIGILFEQAGSGGHAQETVHGVLKFPFTIKNHFTASLSTIEAAQNLRTEILNYQRNFFQKAAKEAAESETRAYVYGIKADEGRTYHLTEMLRRQDIKVYHLAEKVKANGYTFLPEGSFIIPVEQQQYRFLKAHFERRTEFPDSLFYDVSAWTMQYAFNMPFAELEEFDEDLLGKRVKGLPEFPEGEIIGGKAEYAYLFAWDEYYAPRAVNRLLKNDVLVKVAEKPFTAKTAKGMKQFDYGSILVPLAYQTVDENKIYTLMKKAAENDALTIYAVDTGLTPRGIDLGSPSFEVLKKPEVAVIAGEGTSAYEVGQVWHLLDWRYSMTPTLLTKERLEWADINRYNVMVMVNGSYENLDEETVEKIKDWVSEGGTLIATKHAIEWAEEAGLADIEFVSEEKDSTVTPKPYAQMSRDRGAQYIGGAIFHTKLDLTHPLGYGYNNENVPVFRNSTIFMQMPDRLYSTPLYYTDEPLASGYISEENLADLKGTAAIVVSDYGSGTVITMTDNPNFRAFWFGTNKLFTNGIFFGNIIR